MKRSERRKFINKLLSDLNWLRSKENSDRMEYKDFNTTTIVVDTMHMCLDYAEKNNISLFQILD